MRAALPTSQDLRNRLKWETASGSVDPLYMGAKLPTSESVAISLLAALGLFPGPTGSTLTMMVFLIKVAIHGRPKQRRAERS
jgi:hypothetical protein